MLLPVISSTHRAHAVIYPMHFHGGALRVVNNSFGPSVVEMFSDAQTLLRRFMRVHFGRSLDVLFSNPPLFNQPTENQKRHPPGGKHISFELPHRWVLTVFLTAAGGCCAGAITAARTIATDTLSGLIARACRFLCVRACARPCVLHLLVVPLSCRHLLRSHQQI